MIVDNSIHIHINIKKVRELRNLTREQMSSDLNMSLSGYAKIERGETEITITRLHQIAELLEVSISALLNFDTARVLTPIAPLTQAANLGQTQMQDSDLRDRYIQFLEKEVQRLNLQLSNYVQRT